jgi:hypothetical protein
MTAQGHPRAIFSRAIERGNLVAAEASAREVGNLTLEEALRLLFLYAEKDPTKYERAAVRWLVRYLAEGKAVTLLRAPGALGAGGASSGRRPACGESADRAGNSRLEGRKLRSTRQRTLNRARLFTCLALALIVVCFAAVW